MLPNPSIRALRSKAHCRVLSRRFASHEAPQYNEPTGWIFSEKVRYFPSHLSILSSSKGSICVATTTWSEANERGLGSHLVYWDVWYYGSCRRTALLQAGHKVGTMKLLIRVMLPMDYVFNSVFNHGL